MGSEVGSGAVHGVGLQHCEYPFFGPTTEVMVEEGMFFNVDIGLFNFDFGGVRLENGYLVTGSGCEVFSVGHE
jgi:Xaa-Pro aminopeptidase